MLPATTAAASLLQAQRSRRMAPLLGSCFEEFFVGGRVRPLGDLLPNVT